MVPHNKVTMVIDKEKTLATKIRMRMNRKFTRRNPRNTPGNIEEIPTRIGSTNYHTWTRMRPVDRLVPSGMALSLFP